MGYIKTISPDEQLSYWCYMYRNAPTKAIGKGFSEKDIKDRIEEMLTPETPNNTGKWLGMLEQRTIQVFEYDREDPQKKHIIRESKGLRPTQKGHEWATSIEDDFRIAGLIE